MYAQHFPSTGSTDGFPDLPEIRALADAFQYQFAIDNLYRALTATAVSNHWCFR